jgi:hypothetical protein
MPLSVATGASTPPVYPAGGTGNSFSANGFIPEIWSGKLVEKFYASTVLAAISNTDYEGEIKNQGDKVRIRTKPTVTIKDYKVDGSLELERPEGSVLDLLIDKAKYFNCILDDVMEVQSDLNALNMWSDDAGEQMKIQIDTAVLLDLLGTPASVNRGLTAGKISGAINLGVTGTPVVTVARESEITGGKVEIIDVLLRLGQALDEQNIPETGRWVVMPTWASVLIKRSELRQAYLSGDSTTILRNGRLGMVDRFTIYVSNLLPFGTAAGLASGEYAIYAGHAHGLTFASQVSKVETLRSEMTFGTILRGLQVYGYKVVDNTALAQAIVTKG